MTRPRDAVWHAGERAALEAYRRRGFRVLARNWRCSLGELDLVLERDGLVVFCEVKARRGAGVAGPHESVGHAKRRKIRVLAEVFLASWRPVSDARCRFDVASVLLGPGREADVHLFEDAF
jgi:putative endonuclease